MSAGTDGKVAVHVVIDTSGLNTSLNNVNRQITTSAQHTGTEAGHALGHNLTGGASSTITGGSGRLTSAANTIGNTTGQTMGRSMLAGLKAHSAAIGAAGAAILGGVAAGAMYAANKASVLEQAAGSVTAVFKDQAPAMEAAAKAAVDLGLSQSNYSQMAAIIGSQLKNAGTPMGELAGKTQDLIKLGADFSAMYGGTATEAVEAISSAFKGETDPIERYGISIKEADIAAEALRLGLLKTSAEPVKVAAATAALAKAQENLTKVHKDGTASAATVAQAEAAVGTAQQAVTTALEGKTEEMTKAAKAQAIMSLLTTQGTDAIGASAREHDTAAASLQRQKAATENAAAAIGSALLPPLAQMAQALAGVAGWLGKHPGLVQVLAIGAAILGVAMIALSVAVQVMTASMLGLNLAFLANPITWVVLAVVALVAAIVIAYNKSETFRNIVQAAGRAAAAAFGWVVDKVKAIWHALGVVIDWVKGHWPLLLAILTGPIGLAVLWITKHWDTVMAFFKAIPGKIGALFKGVANFITAPFRSAFNAISRLWNSTIGKLSWTVPDWVPALGGHTLAAPKLPELQGLATGGTVTQAGAFLVGERGPEVVNLPAGAAVTPNGGGSGTVTININGGNLDEVRRVVEEAVSGNNRRLVSGFRGQVRSA